MRAQNFCMISFRAAFALCSAVALVLVLSLTRTANSTSASVAPVAVSASPAYGWQPSNSETLTLSPASARGFRIASSGERVRVSISSDAAVQLGFVPESLTHIARTANDLNFPALDCAAVQVLDAQRECELPAGEHVLLVQDSRTAGDALLSFAALLTGNSAPAEASVKTTTAKITLYRWTCISNCP
jgi:hypothetical protein